MHIVEDYKRIIDDLPTSTMMHVKAFGVRDKKIAYLQPVHDIVEDYKRIFSDLLPYVSMHVENSNSHFFNSENKDRQSLLIGEIFYYLKAFVKKGEKMAYLQCYFSIYDLELWKHVEKNNRDSFKCWCEKNPSQTKKLISVYVSWMIGKYIVADDVLGFHGWCEIFSLKMKQVEQWKFDRGMIKGFSLLNLAACIFFADGFVLDLLNDGFSLEVEKLSEFSVLHHAVICVDCLDDGLSVVQKKNLSIIQALIDAGMDVSALTSDGRTVLSLAAFSAHEYNMHLFKLLLKSGADPNLDSFVNSPMYKMMVIYAADKEVSVFPFVKLLFKHHYNANHDNNISAGEHGSILHVAVKALKITLSSISSETSAQHKYFDGMKMIELILESGVDLDIIDEDGSTALELAEQGIYMLENNNIRDCCAKIVEVIGGHFEKNVKVHTTITSPDIKMLSYNNLCEIL